MQIPVTQELVQYLFNYNKETGILYWKVSLSRRVKIGDKVNSLNNGYYTVRIYGKSYAVHRIIWLYVYGYLPENDLDHIDRNRINNRIENLREVSRQCNMRNVGKRINNKSNIVGVSFIKKKFVWYANIMLNKKTYNLGFYADYNDAVCARLAAEQCLNWQGCDSDSSAYKYVKTYINNLQDIDNGNQR